MCQPCVQIATYFDSTCETPSLQSTPQKPRHWDFERPRAWGESHVPPAAPAKMAALAQLRRSGGDPCFLGCWRNKMFHNKEHWQGAKMLVYWSLTEVPNMQNVGRAISLFSSFKVTNSGLQIVAGELQNVRQGACAGKRDSQHAVLSTLKALWNSTVAGHYA